MKTAKQVHEEIAAAFEAGDFATMLALFSPDSVVREAPGLPFGGEYVGHDGLQKLFATVGEIFELSPTLLDVYERSATRSSSRTLTCESRHVRPVTASTCLCSRSSPSATASRRSGAVLLGHAPSGAHGGEGMSTFNYDDMRGYSWTRLRNARSSRRRRSARSSGAIAKVGPWA